MEKIKTMNHRLVGSHQSYLVALLPHVWMEGEDMGLQGKVAERYSSPFIPNVSWRVEVVTEVYMPCKMKYICG